MSRWTIRIQTKEKIILPSNWTDGLTIEYVLDWKTKFRCPLKIANDGVWCYFESVHTKFINYHCLEASMLFVINGVAAFSYRSSFAGSAESRLHWGRRVYRNCTPFVFCKWVEQGRYLGAQNATHSVSTSATNLPLYMYRSTRLLPLPPPSDYLHELRCQKFKAISSQVSCTSCFLVGRLPKSNLLRFFIWTIIN